MSVDLGSTLFAIRMNQQAQEQQAKKLELERQQELERLRREEQQASQAEALKLLLGMQSQAHGREIETAQLLGQLAGKAGEEAVPKGKHPVAQEAAEVGYKQGIQALQALATEQAKWETEQELEFGKFGQKQQEAEFEQEVQWPVMAAYYDRLGRGALKPGREPVDKTRELSLRAVKDYYTTKLAPLKARINEWEASLVDPETNPDYVTLKEQYDALTQEYQNELKTLGVFMPSTREEVSDVAPVLDFSAPDVSTPVPAPAPTTSRRQRLLDALKPTE